jgi:zinc transporter
LGGAPDPLSHECHIVSLYVWARCETKTRALPNGFALESIMDSPARPLGGLIWAFRFHPDGRSEGLDVDQPISDQSGWLWLHFNLADRRSSQFLISTSYLPAPARERLIAIDDHQQLHRTDACIYGIVADLVCKLDGVTEEIGFLHFAITAKMLISGRRHALNAVQATRQALREGLRVATPTALIEQIMEQMIEAVHRYADDLAGDLDGVEERILTDDIGEGLRVDRKNVGRTRRMTVRLHRQLITLRSLIDRFERDAEPPATLGLATERLVQRLDWLDTEIVALRDRSHLLQEEITLKTAEQTNRNLHVLAIVTTVLLPATLVAGIFGMNVEMPFAQGSGFVWAMAILVGATSLAYWLLKRTGILRR